MATIATFIVVPLAIVPLFMTYDVGKFDRQEGRLNMTYYSVSFKKISDCQSQYIDFPQMTYSKVGLANGGLMIKITFWWTSWFLKIIPCALMTYFTLSLVHHLKQASKRRKNMKTTTNHRRRRQLDQKTRMLVAILVCYLLSVLPFGITVPLVGVLGRPFKANVFDPLFNVFDLFGLINSLATFVLLISMSSLFRQTFQQMFCDRNPSNLSRDQSQKSQSINRRSQIASSYA